MKLTVDDNMMNDDIVFDVHNDHGVGMVIMTWFCHEQN